METTLNIPAGRVTLPGDLEVPAGARAIVVFAHGSGSSRQSPRNRMVASAIRASGRVGTLLFDLLTPGEDAVYANRFDIGRLAERLEETISESEAAIEGGEMRHGGIDTTSVDPEKHIAAEATARRIG